MQLLTSLYVRDVRDNSKNFFSGATSLHTIFFHCIQIILYLCDMNMEMKDSNNYHRMGRRHIRKDYSLPGIYHVTISTNRDLRQPLGRVIGDADAPDDSPKAPKMDLSEVGRMVEQELKGSISKYYPMIEVRDYIVMPEHLHAIIVVKNTIISANGRITHLGHVIAGFKKGCNRKYWDIIGLRGEPAAAGSPQPPSASLSHLAVPPQESPSHPAVPPQESPSRPAVPPQDPLSRLAVHPQGLKRTPSDGTTGRPPLFAQGYVDVMPVKDGQLEQQRQYIHDNPRSRLLRTQNRSLLQPQRSTIKTALLTKALLRYLQQECHPSQIGPEQWQELQERLLTENGMVLCDSYGNIEIAQRRLLPVVCHRKDSSQFFRQKQSCLAAAANGAVLVSPRIANGEQKIMDEAEAKGYPVIIIADNGFPEIYHPSKEKINLCMSNHLLLLTPWKYRYRLSEVGITVAECKTMNCVAQALCRTKDDWWNRE